jgi:large repetitive protein
MTTIPAYTISGLTRPELFLDPNGNIVLTPDAQAFANQYGLKALYLGCPPGTPWPPVTGLLLTTPVDTNAAANSIAEGAAVNTPVGITAEAHDIVGFPITYSLTNSANGAFKINSTTDVVTVADPTKIDFETAPGHSYSITVQATDGIFSSSQTFTIGVTDIAPSTPTDSNAAANAVTEGGRRHRRRHHRCFDRRQRTQCHLVAQRRQLRRRFCDQRHDRRDNGRRSEQDRL